MVSKPVCLSVQQGRLSAQHASPTEGSTHLLLRMFREGILLCRPAFTPPSYRVSCMGEGVRMEGVGVEVDKERW